MIYAYIRVSTEKQTVENQRYSIMNAAGNDRKLIDEWVEETASGKKSATDRKLGELLAKLKKGDILYISELSRLGRSLLEVMSILHSLMQKDVQLFAVKEGYVMGNNLSAKTMAFAFSLAAEIERDLISQRTKEGLARRKSEGVQLGRPAGSKSKETKLSGKEVEIRELLSKNVSFSAIGRIYGVDRQTVSNFIKRLDDEKRT